MYRDIRIYQTIGGREPFTRWLNTIKDRKTVARIRARLDRLRLNNFGDYKIITKDLYELRMTFNSDYRIYFTLSNTTVIILLCGGDKGSQPKDIINAKLYLRDIKDRINEIEYIE